MENISFGSALIAVLYMLVLFLALRIVHKEFGMRALVFALLVCLIAGILAVALSVSLQ